MLKAATYVERLTSTSKRKGNCNSRGLRLAVLAKQAGISVNLFALASEIGDDVMEKNQKNSKQDLTTEKGIGSFFAGYPTGAGGHQYYQQPYGFPPPTRPYGSYPPPGVISFPPGSTAYPSYQPNYSSSVDPPIAYPYPAAPGYPFASYPYAAPPSYYPSAAYPAFSCCPPGCCHPAPAPPSYYSGQHYYGRGG